MTIIHALVIICALAVVAYCGSSSVCHDMMPQLGTLAGSAIGGALGNAMASVYHGKHAKRKRIRK